MEIGVRKQGLILLALVAVLVFAALPASAQSNTLTSDQQELVDYVKGVFDQFFELESYSTSGAQSVVQHITAKSKGTTIEVNQTIDQELSGQVQQNDDGNSMMAQIDQNISQVTGGQSQEISQTIEMILTDGDFYMRFSNVSPATIASIYPKDWVNLAENPTAFPGANLINADQYTSVFSGQFKYPLNADTIQKIKELPGETLEGVETRVITLVFNAPALFASGEMDQILSVFNAGSLGVDMDQLRESMGENAALELTVWIGADDDMIYRQDTAMTLAGEMGAIVTGVDSMNLEQQSTGSFTFTDFNEPVTIEAPDVK
jgi:hypothetical protein